MMKKIKVSEMWRLIKKKKEEKKKWFHMVIVMTS